MSLQRRRLLAAVLAGLAVLLAGCGAGNLPPTSTPVASSTDGTPTEQPSTPGASTDRPATTRQFTDTPAERDADPADPTGTTDPPTTAVGPTTAPPVADDPDPGPGPQQPAAPIVGPPGGGGPPAPPGTATATAAPTTPTATAEPPTTTAESPTASPEPTPTLTPELPPGSVGALTLDVTNVGDETRPLVASVTAAGVVGGRVASATVEPDETVSLAIRPTHPGPYTVTIESGESVASVVWRPENCPVQRLDVRLGADGPIDVTETC